VGQIEGAAVGLPRLVSAIQAAQQVAAG
jgi:hypothetical protein